MALPLRPPNSSSNDTPCARAAASGAGGLRPTRAIRRRLQDGCRPGLLLSPDVARPAAGPAGTAVPTGRNITGEQASMSYDVRGKTILITGANRGIGKSLVETFLAHGAARVYAAVRDPSSAGPLVEQYGDTVVPVAIDLGDPESIYATAAAAGDAEVVINNAGVLTSTSPLDEDVSEQLDYELRINVHGLIHMARAFAPVLAANGGGAFVQLNSVASMKNFPAFSTYSASKAAAYSMTQALRETLREQGTRVVSVHPGPIATDMGDAAGLTEIAEPPSLVGEALIAGLESGAFHVWPDTMAKQVAGAYQGFAENVVEADMSEG